ncbi:MAG: hypothetical protein JXR58_05180 [Bacteroidales bacterium]|nr:hypothetical protein [Bacteroidales bacterium]
MLKGLIISLSLYLLWFLLVAWLEYLGRFSIQVRTALFFTTLVAYAIVFTKFILIPALKYFSIGKIINHKQAATIIAKFFPNVSDKLFNTLELAELAELDNRSRDLVLASIDLRTKEFSGLHFSRAIKLRKNLKYLKHLGALSAVFLLIFMFYPAILTEGTERIINYNNSYVPEAPFHFQLINQDLNCEKGKNIKIEVSINGQYVPDRVKIRYGGNSFYMVRDSKSLFSYEFKNINNSLDFHFEAEGISSSEFNIRVLPTPAIKNFTIEADVPEYTGEKDFIVDNSGDITVPQGTKIKWVFNTIENEKLILTVNDSLQMPGIGLNNFYTVEKRAMQPFFYHLSLYNKFVNKEKVIRYSINVIPDLFPEIRVSSLSDSLKPSLLYFKGLIQDDYGFSSLKFKYSIKESDSTKTFVIPVEKNNISQEFYYAFDFSTLGIKDKTIEYYFEVSDNDGVNGAKTSRTGRLEFKLPSDEELEKMEDEANENVKSKLDETKKLTEELKKDVKELREKMVRDEVSEWEQQKLVEEIEKKQQKLDMLMNEMASENLKKNEMLNSFSEQQQEIMQKQEELQKMMEELIDDELKKMLDELNELMKDFNKEELKKFTKEMEMSLEDLSKQLDKNMEMLKRYEVEKDVEKTINKLNELAEKQEKLSEDVKDKNQSKEDLEKREQEHKEDFDKLMQDYKETLEKNSELEKPMKLEEFSEQEEQIKSGFEQTKEEMQQNKMNKASKSQKQNSSQMKQMAQQMQQSMESGAAQQQSEDLENLKQIIDNLVTFSFNQEQLISEMNKMKQNDPAISNINRGQLKINDDFEIIKDSLYAFAKRNPMIDKAITDELLKISKQKENIIYGFNEQKINDVKTSQQYIMTSANNLALLLAEVMQQMMQAMQSMCSGDGECKKPGQKPGQKPGKGMQQMKMQQQGLKQQLEQMIDQLKNGEGMPGKAGGSKEIAKMIAENEKFRQALDEMMNGTNLSPESAKKLKEIKSLVEQNERDLANRNITPNLLKRQNLILTRLLEAENSEYQREIDKKRESNESKIENLSNPKEIFEYKRMNLKFDEMLNNSNLKLYKYYDKKYKDYLIKLNE